MAMNSNELKATARQMTIEAIMPALQENDAVKFADASFAILQTIEDQEIWCEVTVKTKAYKDTKVSKAFDPFVAAQAWEEDKRIKSANKEAKAAEKAAKKKKEDEEGA